LFIYYFGETNSLLKYFHVTNATDKLQEVILKIKLLTL